MINIFLRKKIIYFFIPLTLLLFFAAKLFFSTSKSEIHRPEVIAHAGGAINYKISGSNSLEALNSNYKKGLRYFELDFSWTSDNHLALIHDWSTAYDYWFPQHNQGIPTLKYFVSLRMINNLTQLSFSQLFNWLEKHEDAYIITDIKSENIKGLKMIASAKKKFMNQFLPQIYDIDEYDRVSSLGFEKIILTMYKAKSSVKDILDFSKKSKLFAITMPDWMVTSKRFCRELKEMGVFVYAHTVNDRSKQEVLKRFGAQGIYTDLLL